MKKLPFKRRTKTLQDTAPTRITNETVAEHRERILAGGRRFKYPMQYARHKLVINAILITIGAVILLVVLGWWQLYPAQNTSTFFYRLTRAVPVPVATVDGRWVSYADYLMYYRGSTHYLQQNEPLNLQGDSGKRQTDYNKRESLRNAELDTYVAKLADQLHITITNDQIDQDIKEARTPRTGPIPPETYDATTMSVLGWTPDENRQVIRNNLMRVAVSYALDTAARQQAEKAASLVAAPDADFDKIATQLGGEGTAKVEAGVSGFVPVVNRDDGRSAAAAKLQKGQVSGVIKTPTADSYYFVKLIDKTDTQLSYAYLRIPLTVLNNQFAQLKSQHKIQEFITVPAVDTQTK